MGSLAGQTCIGNIAETEVSFMSSQDGEEIELRPGDFWQSPSGEGFGG